jgi:predicted regulator of Ras-like GTPase activity (Roadblock/LC7/MglB family)
MNENPDQRHRVVSDICQLKIEQMLRENAFASGAMVSTRDGFDVAKSLHQTLHPSKLAAMSSSLLSVADAIVVLGGGESCANVVIESDAGQIVTMSIPCQRITLLVTVFCTANASLGQVLWQVRRCAQEIGRELDAANAQK